MIEVTGDLFRPGTYNPPLPEPPDAICITTNGFIRKSGQAVCGRGCAAEAKRFVPDLEKVLGKMIRTNGNVCQVIFRREGRTALVAFPTKPAGERCLPGKENVLPRLAGQFKPGEMVPGWACYSRLDIIEQSARELAEMTAQNGWERVVLPRPGVGNGGLEWTIVRDLLVSILVGDTYLIVSPGERQ